MQFALVSPDYQGCFNQALIPCSYPLLITQFSQVHSVGFCDSVKFIVTGIDFYMGSCWAL